MARRRCTSLACSAIIPGQLYLSEAIARAGVMRIDEVPVVDGLAATLKMAEAMADLKGWRAFSRARGASSISARGKSSACDGFGASKPMLQGVEPVPTMPGPYGRFVRAEYTKWGKIIRDAGIKLD